MGRNSKKGNALTKRALPSIIREKYAACTGTGMIFPRTGQAGMMDGYVTDYGVFDLDRDGQERNFYLICF